MYIYIYTRTYRYRCRPLGMNCRGVLHASVDGAISSAQTRHLGNRKSLPPPKNYRGTESIAISWCIILDILNS